MTERRLTDERIEAIYDDMEAKNWEHEAWEIRSHINWLEARVKEQGERADNLQRAYELKIDDLRRETLRASTLQEALNKEHQALTELWERHEKMRRALSADTEARNG